MSVNRVTIKNNVRMARTPKVLKSLSGRDGYPTPDDDNIMIAPEDL